MTEVPLGADPRLDGPVTLVAYSPQWPSQFEGEAKRIRSALGERALVIEHVGSTSVPGLIAKPVIDICLVVADSADEPAYVPSLERAGYVLADPGVGLVRTSTAERAGHCRQPARVRRRFCRGRPDAAVSGPAPLRPGRSRAVRADETGTGGADLGVPAGLRRCQE